MILFLPEPLICAPPISASAVVGRNARLGLLWCVGHAHTTEAIPECIRGGGIREAESNMRLLGIVSATYRLGHSGNYFESRTAAPSVVMSPRGHLAALVNQLEIQKIQTPAATQPICRRFPVRTYRKPVMLPPNQVYRGPAEERRHEPDLQDCSRRLRSSRRCPSCARAVYHC
jgi:hypothetical protein